MKHEEWVRKNCKFAIDQQMVMEFDEPGMFTGKPAELQHPEFQRDIQDTGATDYDDDFAGGFYHVTTNLEGVMKWGALKSRKQLGGTEGLGGGMKNEAPGKISLTYNLNKAWQLYDTIKFAISAAQNQVSASHIYDYLMSQYGLPEINLYPQSNAMRIMSKYLPKRILEDESMEGLEATLDRKIKNGKQKYEFLQEFDDALGRDESEIETGGEYMTPNRVGFTAPYETFSKINPNNVAILQLEVRRNAVPEHVQAELELRFDPDDVRLAPTPIVKK